LEALRKKASLDLLRRISNADSCLKNGSQKQQNTSDDLASKINGTSVDFEFERWL
jgi:hypothetical protein